MNKVTSKQRHHPSKNEHSNNNDGIVKMLQDTVNCLSTGNSGFVISCKENVLERINENRLKNFTIPG